MIESMKTKPIGLPLMTEAFLSCASWAISRPEMVEEFKKETGLDLESIASQRGLNKLIDEQTGYARESFVAWLDWVAMNIWGVDE